MKSSNPLKTRLHILLGLFGAVLLAYLAVLCSTQIIHGSEYRAKSITSNATTETVAAPPGFVTLTAVPAGITVPALPVSTQPPG